jgi:chromosome segregation and condensation protein ScpB
MNEKKLPLSLMEMAKLRETSRKKLKNTTNKRNSSSKRRSSAVKKIQRTYRKRIKNKKIYDQNYKELPDDIKNIIALPVKIYKKKENTIKEFKESNLRTLKKYRDFFKNEIVKLFDDQEAILKELETIINNIKKFKIKNIDDQKFKEDFDILKITIKKIFEDLGNVLDTLIEISISRNDYIYSLIEEFYNNLEDEDHSNAI